MKTFRWAAGIILILSIITIEFTISANIFIKWFYPLLFACFLSLYSFFKWNSAADRVISLRVISALVIGFCGILSFVYKNDTYMDIAIAWSIQAFIGSLIFAKYLEGRSLDD